MMNFGRDISTNNERKRDGHIGRIASISDGGKSMNVNNLNNSQLRELMNISPYGISSCGKSGMKAQVIINDDSNNSVVGVYDPDKPDVDIGEIMLYSIGGASVYLDKHGNIKMIGDINVDGKFIINDIDINALSSTDISKINDDITNINEEISNIGTDIIDIGTDIVDINTKLLNKPSIGYVDALALRLSSGISNIVVPETFGAKGDGITDDTVAMQKAIDMASGYTTQIVDTSSLTHVSGYLGGNGDILESSDWTVYSIFPVEPSTIYVISNIASSSMAKIVLYRSDLSVSRSIDQTTVSQIVTGADELFIRYSSKDTVPILEYYSAEGRILYLNRRSYLITNRLYIRKPLYVLGASRDDSVLLFDGVDWTGTEIEDDPVNYPESHGVINIKCDGTILQNFTIKKRGIITNTQASNWHGITMHYVVGAEIMQVYVRGFKAGVFSFAGWNKHYIGCNFIDNKVAGIQYLPLELQTVGNWSSSGDIIQSCQFIGNDIGLFMDRVFETSVQNCIFEYNNRAIYTFGCLDCFFINCWNEANNDKLHIIGNAVFQGGYNISKDTIWHEPNGEGTVTISKPHETVCIRAGEVIFYQTRGIITKGVSIGSDYLNMLVNPSFGTIAVQNKEPWFFDNSTHILLDKTKTINDVNSVCIDCSFSTWDSDPYYGFRSDMVDIEEGVEYVFTGYIMTENFTGIDKGVHIEVHMLTTDGIYIGNYIDYGSNDITPIGNNVWEKFSVSFTGGIGGGKCRVRVAIAHYGKIWISSPMLSIATVTSDQITIKKTEDPKQFNTVDYLGNITKQISSKDYVDDKFITIDSVTGTKYTWSVTVANGIPSVSLTPVV